VIETFDGVPGPPGRTPVSEIEPFTSVLAAGVPLPVVPIEILVEKSGALSVIAPPADAWAAIPLVGNWWS